MPPNRNYAVLIAVDHTDDRALHGPEFATAGVRALKAALEVLGFSRKNLSVLTGKGAVRAAVEARLDSLFERAREHPGRLLLYYSGPGFNCGGLNYLACRDTTIADLEGTGIDLDRLIQRIRNIPFPQIQIFLDAAFRASPLPLSEEAIERSMEDDERLVVFASGRFGEPTYSIPGRKLGVWVRHVVQALSGAAPEALTDEGVLTAGSLQTFLSEQVPRTLRDSYADRRKRQSPWLGGALQSGEMTIADFSATSGRGKFAFGSLAANVREFVFRRQDRSKVKSLSGFRQGLHHSPKWSSRQADAFVAKIAHGEIEADVAARFAEIRQGLAYRRRQIEIHSPDEGDASIRTPDFQYTVSVRLDGDDPTSVLITRELSDLRRPEILGEEPFARIFDGSFDSVRLILDRAIEVEDLVDSAESSRLPVTYPPDCSTCTIHAADGATIEVARDGVVLKYPGVRSLEHLTRGLDQIMRLVPRTSSLPGPSASRARSAEST